MAEKVSVALVDDYDGESAAQETVTFAVDGRTYEIDLSGAHASALRADFQPWVAHARLIKGGRGGVAVPRGPRIPREQLVEIRQWARRQGHAVAERGAFQEKSSMSSRSAGAQSADRL